MTDVHLQCYATDLTDTVYKVVTHMQARTPTRQALIPT